jgi:hypothetical protein
MREEAAFMNVTLLFKWCHHVARCDATFSCNVLSILVWREKNKMKDNFI